MGGGIGDNKWVAAVAVIKGVVAFAITICDVGDQGLLGR